MRSDSFGNSIFQETDLVELIYKNKLELLDQILLDDSEEIQKFKNLSELNLKIVDKNLYSVSKEEFDDLFN